MCNSNSYPRLCEKENTKLMKNISNEEVRKAMFYIRGVKALRDDGFLAKFYQLTWNIIGGMFTIL